VVPEFEKAGLSFVGRDESGKRMEIIELPNYRFSVDVQFHPEFKSRPQAISTFLSIGSSVIRTA